MASEPTHDEAVAQYRVALLNSKKEQASVDALNAKLRDLRKAYEKTYVPSVSFVLVL